MRMRTGVIRVVAVVGIGVALAAGAGAAGGSDPPGQPAIDFARRASDLMLATLFAALIQEFDETTPANVAEGSQSISLIFNDRNDDMRLVGTRGPLRESDRPQDAFEEAALERALTGTAYDAVEKVHGKWTYRRSVPLANFRSECALCHPNFPPGPTADWVGALMLRVPVVE